MVKQRGTSVLRLALGTERDFHRLMLKAETDSDLSDVRLDEALGALVLAYKTLVWMESDDPGGAVFSQRMLSQPSEALVDNMLRELMATSCEPPAGLDPEQVLRDHPALLLHRDWKDSDSPLCKSFDDHLAAMATVTAQERRSAGQESTWLCLYKQDVCEQLVKTHYEVVRGLSFALALIDYQHQATGDDELDDESYERLRHKLRDDVLPMLSRYHIMRWSAGRALMAGADSTQGAQPTEVQSSLNAHKTLLSLCIDYTDVADTQTVDDFVRDPVTFICDPICAGGGEEGLIWKTFKALRRETLDDSALASQWKDLLALCDHPATTHAGSDLDSEMRWSDAAASNSWWYHTVLVSFVRGYSCLHLSRWKEANKHLSHVLQGSRRLISGGDVSGRILVAPHPLITLQQELVYDRQARRVQLRDSMRKVTAATKWGPAVNNLLDYFLLLHDYLGSKGLVHSMRELLLARIQDSGAGSGDGGVNGAIECFCALMPVAMESLRDLEARLEEIEVQHHEQGYQNDAECVFAVDCLRYLITTAQHYLRVSWLTMYTDCELFDEAYDLIAEPISLCKDDDISKMRQVLEEGVDEYGDVEHWLNSYSSMDIEGYNNSTLKQDIQEKLDLRSRKEAYRCLEGFVSAQRLQSRPDKLCSYPWVNCSHTVDTLLRERCENKEHLDEAYHARYAFNIARSDYRTAGDTMMTYWFNLVVANMQGNNGGGGSSGTMPDGGERLVDLNMLQQQANSCLSAINCYSLIDQRFAFWIPPQAALSPFAGSASNKKRQANTQGSRDETMLDLQNNAASSVRAPEVITLPMMLQHYALLRARIRLVELESRYAMQQMQSMHLNDRTAAHRMVSFSVSQQHALAEDTVAELLRMGLLDDAISLAAAFCPFSSSTSPTSAPGSLATEDMCRAITERCLKSFSSHSARLIDEDGVESDDSWDFLRRFLIHFDGSAKPPSLVQQLPHKERDSALALDPKCHKPFGGLTRVAAESFLQMCPDPECVLPPWLMHAMRAGTRGSGGLGFDAAGGDTSGLLRLLLRYNRSLVLFLQRPYINTHSHARAHAHAHMPFVTKPFFATLTRSLSLSDWRRRHNWCHIA